MTRLTLDRVNDLGGEEFVRRFGSLYEHSPWVAEAAEKERPFGSLGEMSAAFSRAVREASPEKQVALVRAHPDLAGKAALAGELTEESAREQSSAGLDRLSPEEFETFTQVNREYREKFDIPMVVAVRDHTKESIIAQAKARLGNTREQELQTALGEIDKIARIRLADLVEAGEEK